MNKVNLSFPRRRESRSPTKSGMTLVALALLPFVIAGLLYVIKSKPSTVRANGQLTYDLGVPSGEPIFKVHNILPGDCEEREVRVENGGDDIGKSSVRSSNQTDLDFLSRGLTMQISEGTTILYSNSLEQFFTDSSTLDGIPLSSLPRFSQKTYLFKVCLPSTTGNEYQNTQVSFDLIFGEVISPFVLPSECEKLAGQISFVLTGTEGKDKIRGSHASELIIGLGGDDDLDGSGGNDCIVGGEGKDKIDGGQGDDIILGNQGDDDIEGGQGDDVIYGNSGNDKIDAGSGKDIVYGNEGDDDIDGKSQDDYLDGGEGYDKLDGGTGHDTCVNGENVDSCE